MKQLVTLLAATLIFFACKKEDNVAFKTYPIRVGYPSIYASGTKLVVTATNTGEILGDFDLPVNSKEFSGNLELKEDILLELMDVHLIQPNFWIDPLSIKSHMSVPIGSFVYFSPKEHYPRTANIYLNIEGIESFDTLTTGYIRANNVLFTPLNKRVSAELPTEENRGCILRVKANGLLDYRYYYLPDSLQGDTIHLNWNDFSPEINIKHIALSSNDQSFDFRIDAVSPDFTKAISIASAWETTLDPEFNLPQEVPADWLLHISMRSFKSGFSDQIFNMNDPLEIHPTDITVDQISIVDNKIIISTSENVDYITVNVTGDLSWEFNGTKEAFKSLIIPDLSPYLDVNMNASSLTWQRISIKQFDQNNSTDIREGLPYRNAGFFPVARSGYHELMYY